MSCTEQEATRRNPETLWHDIRQEALSASEADPVLESFFAESILKYESLSDMIAGRVAARLWTRETKSSESRLRESRNLKSM